MDTEEQRALPEDVTVPIEESDPELPIKTILLVVGLVCVVVIGIIVSNILKQRNEPGVECAYRGGTWLRETKECIFEGGAAGGKEQVGMKVPSLTLHIEKSVANPVDIVFTDVEIGGPAVSGKTFDVGGGTQGSVSVLNHLAKVHTASKDLLMPYVLNTGGSGQFMYLGVFEKTEGGYVLRDSAFVGDRVSPQSVMMGESEDGFSARFAYRDRYHDEPMSAVPSEPRTLEVFVLNHMIDGAYVTGRDGVLYKNLLSVASPLPRAEVASPLRVSGMARGPWFFEASFPVSLVDWDGKIVAEGVAQAKGEWMTEEFVPFEATLTFTLPADMPYKRGTLILRKDNPSGLPEKDDSFEIPVTFK